MQYIEGVTEGVDFMLARDGEIRERNREMGHKFLPNNHMGSYHFDVKSSS
jgi:hypothetical protein